MNVAKSNTLFKSPQSELQEIYTCNNVTGTWRGRVLSKAYVNKEKYEAKLDPLGFGNSFKKILPWKGCELAMNVSCPGQYDL